MFLWKIRFLYKCDLLTARDEGGVLWKDKCLDWECYNNNNNNNNIMYKNANNRTIDLLAVA